MFKALAAFVMRGRIQAIIIALLGSWIPFVPQAVLGLITLRKGWKEGLLISLWASLPAFVGLWVGNVAAPMAMASIAVFFVGFLVCCVLRLSVSWSLTLIASALLAALAALVISVMQPLLLDEITAFFASLVQGPEGQVPPELLALADSWSRAGVTGLVAYWITFSTIVGVLLARWWQALLFNPGGFQAEFHSLRLSSQLALLCAVVAVACFALGADFQFWGSLSSLPLLVAGLGFVHWLVAKKGLSVVALIGVYVALAIIPESALVLMLLALLDAALDLRKKFNTNQSI